MMRLLFAFLSFCLFTNVVTAQLEAGITAGYFFQSIPEWETAAFGTRTNDRLLKSGLAQEIDLKIAGFENYRVEFHLNGGFNNSKTTKELRSYKLQQIDIGISTKIYLLSLEADCDCPTFSRDAGILEKGFFVELSPAISAFKGKIEDQAIVSEDTGLSFKMGVGIGLEIGITDFITISPIVKYNRYFNVEWEDLQADIAAFDQSPVIEGNNTTAINQLYGGIRLALRLKR